MTGKADTISGIEVVSDKELKITYIECNTITYHWWNLDISIGEAYLW